MLQKAKFNFYRFRADRTRETVYLENGLFCTLYLLDGISSCQQNLLQAFFLAFERTFQRGHSHLSILGCLLVIAVGTILPIYKMQTKFKQHKKSIKSCVITLHCTGREEKIVYFSFAFNYFIFLRCNCFLLCGCTILASYSYSSVFLFSFYFVVVVANSLCFPFLPTTTFTAFVSIKFFLLVFSLYCLPLCLFIIALHSFLLFIFICEFLRIFPKNIETGKMR